MAFGAKGVAMTVRLRSKGLRREVERALYPLTPQVQSAAHTGSTAVSGPTSSALDAALGNLEDVLRDALRVADAQQLRLHERLALVVVLLPAAEDVAQPRAQLRVALADLEHLHGGGNERRSSRGGHGRSRESVRAPGPR